MPIKGIISVSPDSCIFPQREKHKKSSTWNVCFFVINSNLLLFNYIFFTFFRWLVFSQQELLYILAPLLPIWNDSSEIPERQHPRLKSSLRPPNKTEFSTFRMCVFFSSWHIFLTLFFYHIDKRKFSRFLLISWFEYFEIQFIEVLQVSLTYIQGYLSRKWKDPDSSPGLLTLKLGLFSLQ